MKVWIHAHVLHLFFESNKLNNCKCGIFRPWCKTSVKLALLLMPVLQRKWPYNIDPNSNIILKFLLPNCQFILLISLISHWSTISCKTMFDQPQGDAERIVSIQDSKSEVLSQRSHSTLMLSQSWDTCVEVSLKLRKFLLQ